MAATLFDLSGRAALVTGGSKGIGKAIAKGFAVHGADVFLCSRHENELKAAAEEIRGESNRRVEYMVADMTRREDVKQLAETAQSVMGKVDILVNNAGSNTPQKLEETDDATWDRIMELNLNSCLFLTRELVGGMKQRGWGRVIHIASIMGITASAQRSAYCATKGALISMAHSQAVELGTAGVTVNCISPGPIATDLPMSLLSKEQQENFARRTALHRWGKPEELAGPALLLASDAGSYITGENLVVDGGCTILAFETQS